MTGQTTEPGPPSEALSSAVLGTITSLLVGLVTNSKLAQLVAAVLLGVLYWWLTRGVKLWRRRRAARAVPVDEASPRRRLVPAPTGRQAQGRRRVSWWGVLGAMLALAVLLNLLAVVLYGMSVVAAVVVLAWVLLLVVPLRLLRWTSDAAQSLAAQVAAFSVGAAIGIGGVNVLSPQTGPALRLVTLQGDDRVAQFALQPDGTRDAVFTATVTGPARALIMTVRLADGTFTHSQWDTIADADPVLSGFFWHNGADTWLLAVANQAGRFLNHEDGSVPTLQRRRPTEYTLMVQNDGSLQPGANVWLTIVRPNGELVTARMTI